MLNVGIIGCGLIGRKRALSLDHNQIIAVSDVNVEVGKNMARDFNADYHQDYKKLISREDIDVVFVATTHNHLTKIGIDSLEFNKHILIEKPAGISVSELKNFKALSKKNPDLKIHIGFNHRFHPALMKAKNIVDSGELGKLMFIRGRYGHGGRIGYESEWRANLNISGGGELIDQGSHLIDLSRWFLGGFKKIHGTAKTYFWNMDVEDNGFMILENSLQQTAFLHASCTEWKNLFSYEIYGECGKLHINGLGGSYGKETLTYYKMLPEMGPPKEINWEFDEDTSWKDEILNFFKAIELNLEASSSIDDAIANLEIIQNIYRNSDYDYNA